jgi:porin
MMLKSVNSTIIRTIFIALTASASCAIAQESSPVTVSPYLFGDASGSRAARAEKGFSHDLLWTNYYQGSISGPEPKDIDFGGRVDLYLNFDTEKLWSWEGGGIVSHIEYRYGESSIGQGGTLLPSNIIDSLPLLNKEKVIISDLHITQKFSKGMLLAGKINAVDLLANGTMIGRRGLDGFSNINFVAPISGLVPPVIFGGVFVMPGKPNWTFMVFDPSDQTANTGLERPFSKGVNLGATASWPANFTQYGGTQSLGATFSTAEGTDLSDIQIGGGGTGTIGTKRGKYVVSYQIEQLLNPNWGVFLKLSKADGNPNAHDYSYQLGLSGKGLFANRPADRFGIGYYQFAFSRILGDAILPLIDLNPEAGIEAYYNMQIRPGLFITADLQRINPARQDRDSSTFAGVRMLMRF